MAAARAGCLCLDELMATVCFHVQALAITLYGVERIVDLWAWIEDLRSSGLLRADIAGGFSATFQDANGGQTKEHDKFCHRGANDSSIRAAPGEDGTGFAACAILSTKPERAPPLLVQQISAAWLVAPGS